MSCSGTWGGTSSKGSSGGKGWKSASAFSGSSGGKEPKEVVSELTDMLGQLEDGQRDLLELDQPGIDEDRLQALQRGIQRYAALARFG